MRAEAASLGLSLVISSGFRSYWSQQAIYDRYVAADGQAELQLLCDLGPYWPAGSRCQGQFVDLGTQVLSLISIGA